MAAMKRIMKDYKDYEKNPLNGVYLQTSDENFARCTVWFEIEDAAAGRKAWLPMVVIFPQDYPNTAPSCGFPIDFGYTMGASYVKRDGELAGMMVVCLDLVANFDEVHPEFIERKGSGWSSSHSITSLAVNMQALIQEDFLKKNEQERSRILNRCIDYMKNHCTLDAIQLREITAKQVQEPVHLTNQEVSEEVVSVITTDSNGKKRKLEEEEGQEQGKGVSSATNQQVKYVIGKSSVKKINK